MNQEELLVTFGGEVKALGNGHFGGYLVRFSSADDPDLAGDFFTKATDFGIEDGHKTPVYFNHRLPMKTKDGQWVTVKQKIGEGAMKVDDVGVLVDAIVWNRDNYEKAIVAAGKKKKLGWSSGTASHLVDSEPVGKARFLKTWPLGFDSSLTPYPCEPCNDAIPSKSLASLKFTDLEGFNVKSADTDEDDPLDAHIPGQRIKSAFVSKITQIIDDHIDSGHYENRGQVIKALGIETGTETSQVERILDGYARPSDAKLKGFARVLDVTYDALKDAAQKDPARSIKAIFEDALADRQFATWNLWDVYSKVVRRLATMALNSKATGVEFDLAGKLKEVNDEYIARLSTTVLAQIADYMDNSEPDESFYLKSLTDPSADILADLKIDVDQHSQLVESAAAGVVKRFRGFHETRLKAGRVLSDKNRARLAGLMKQMQTVMDDMQKLMDESVPMAGKAEQLAAESQFLRLQARTRQSNALANTAG